MNPEHPEVTLETAEVPFVGLTPLYCIVTDEDEIAITAQSKIVRYSEETLQFLGEQDRFRRHLRLYQPQCLLCSKATLPLERFVSLGDEIRSLAQENADIQNQDVLRARIACIPSVASYLNGLAREIYALQLFRPGRLVVGDSHIIFPEPFDLRMMARCTDMFVDYQDLNQYAPHYEFNSADLRAFLIFFIRFLEFAQTADKYPEIALATTRYCRETAQHGDVVDLMTALEALLVPEEEGIAFKLSQRVANLLGQDAVSRKQLFQKIKEFYSLRSKTVHGAKPGTKELRVQEQLDELREITRKVILSVMALAAELGTGTRLAGLLNDLCLDDDLRLRTQEKASVLLNREAGTGSPE